MRRAGETDARADAEPAAAAPAEPPPSNDRLRILALVAVTVGLIALCVLLAVPFLPAITWGVALAILAWPMHRWIVTRIESPGLSAGVSTLVVVAVIIGPGLLVGYQLTQEAAAAAARAQAEQSSGGWREKVASIPGVGRVLEWTDRLGLDVESEAYNLLGSTLRNAAGLAQGSAEAVVQFLAAVFVLFYAFRDRAVLVRGVRGLLPLTKEETDRVFVRVAGSVHANLYANVLTSLIDSVGFGVLFWLVGLPAPVLWAFVLFILSLLPIVGAGFVWIPAAVYLAMTGRWLAAAGIVAWGTLCFVFVDNLLYMRLVGERMRMHDVLALISFFGGIAVFGMSGMILGPTIVAVTMALLEVWKVRMSGEPDSAPAT
ncbi:MAG TPA: AI-2E family transporter [Gemmataceae bacterium]|jgi:predicted PurR-regulated permease PerM|nr:AI-2E family transporter [Gemmataceae bacterium]